MAEKENSSSLLSFKDFEERGVPIEAELTSFEALMAVVGLASEKLEEEEMIKKEKEKKPVTESKWYSSLSAGKVFDQGSFSRSCDKGKCSHVRVCDQKEKEKAAKPVAKPVIVMYAKKSKAFDAVMEHGTSPENSDTRTWLARVFDEKEIEKALKKPVANSRFDMFIKKKEGFMVASGNKLLGDAMKTSFRASKDDGEERVAEFTKKKKKLKKSESKTDNGQEKGSNSNKKLKRERLIVLNGTPDLPQAFRERIEMLNGSKIDLVIQKRLFSTDISSPHNRLSIPVNQILSTEFLNDDEKTNIDNGGEMSVMLTEPSLREREITLKRWPNPLSEKKKKKKSKCNSPFVLIDEWNNVKRNNKLEIGDLVQIWKFRTLADELCLALVLVRKSSEVVEDANGI